MKTLDYETITASAKKNVELFGRLAADNERDIQNYFKDDPEIEKILRKSAEYHIHAYGVMTMWQCLVELLSDVDSKKLLKDMESLYSVLVNPRRPS